jgi:hypothetical protein
VLVLSILSKLIMKSYLAIKFILLPQTTSWLRHCATNRKVAGSIPDNVIGIFHLYNPSGLTMALGLTQPLREIFSGGKGGRCVGLTTLPHSSADCFEIWEPQTPENLRACPGL